MCFVCNFTGAQFQLFFKCLNEIRHTVRQNVIFTSHEFLEIDSPEEFASGDIASQVFFLNLILKPAV